MHVDKRQFSVGESGVQPNTFWVWLNYLKKKKVIINFFLHKQHTHLCYKLTLKVLF